MTRYVERSRAIDCPPFVDVRIFYDQQSRGVDVAQPAGQMKRCPAGFKVLVDVGTGPHKTQDFVIVARHEGAGECCLGCLCRKIIVIEAAGRRRFGCGLLFLLLAVGAK